ncbi:oxidoreductase [candidate division KSB1 bacterium]|nr:oxidoreductase [candidate division KSB1 bacterium]
MTEATQSFLPLFLILFPICGAILSALLGLRKVKNAREIATFLILLIQWCVSVYISIQVFSGMRFTSVGRSISVDGLSALMGLLVNTLVLLVVVQSVRYLRHEHELGMVREGRLTLYYGLVLLFTGTMNWTVTTNHLVMLYIAMESSTLATALLVAFYRTRASLEAGYKYVLLVVVGMTFSLFGIILIFAAGYPHIGRDALFLNEIGRVAKLIPQNIALLGVAFMTIGFATKAGLVPFHAWLPDAHSEAPSPVSALLSGLIINLGAYALTRTVTIFAPTYHSIVVFIAILASISMLVGILMALVQDDLKRMLAFSSVSQISYVFEGLGLGTYLGIYGGLFHMLNHTIVKALLFLSVGAIMYATGQRRISKLGGLARKMPLTAFAFFVGSLAISGLPPFNGFMSKFTLFLAVGEQKLFWALGISILTGIFTLACMVRAAYLVFWKEPENPTPELEGAREVPFLMYISIVVLALLTILIGVYPNLLYPMLHSATQAVLSIWSLGV